MNRIIKEVESILYFCGLLGRRERVDLVSVTWLSPSDDTEHTQMSEAYDSARKHMGHLNLTRNRLRRLERTVDRFNKNQLVALTEQINAAVEVAPWHKKIFMDKRIPQPMLWLTLVGKKSIDELFVNIYALQNLIVDKKLQLPIEEKDFEKIVNFESEVRKIRKEYLQVRYLAKNSMKQAKYNLEKYRI